MWKMCEIDDPLHRAVGAIIDEVDPMEERQAAEFLAAVRDIVHGMLIEGRYSRRANDA